MVEFSEMQMLVAALLAYALDLIPGAKAWWDAKMNPKQKQVTILVLMLVITLSGAAYRCFGSEGFCPVNWLDFIVETTIQFILNTVVATGAHLSVRYLPSPKEDAAG